MTRPAVENAPTGRKSKNTPQIAEGLEVRRVLLGLGLDREAIVSRARAGGCDLDRWRPRDWAILAREVTRAEDAAELAYPSAARLAQRARLREVRRVLEAASEEPLR